MGMYHIKDVEHLSGIKAHTLRIWEKRYNIIEPKRTKTNIRYYDDEDLKKILNVSLLNRNGYKISKIAGLPNSRLKNEILSLSQHSGNLDAQIGYLITAMIDFDKPAFEKIFSNSIINLGFQETILKVIYPFFKRIGILWITGNIDPAQEHFISNIIRQKIIVAIDSLPEYPKNNTENFVLFLPDGQWHEMGLLLCSYLIKKNGHNDLYLGGSLPLESMMNIEKIVPFKNIVTTVSFSKSKEEVEKEIRELATKFDSKNIFIGGLQENTQFNEMPANIHYMYNLDDFNEYLVQLRQKNLDVHLN